MNRRCNTCAWLSILIVILASCKKDESEKDIVTDINGNVYKTTTIGSQVWMAEDLRTTSYSDGTIIHKMGSVVFGTKRYYNWSEAMKGAVGSNNNPGGVQGACPTDWHLPSESEWKELADFLGGSLVAGGKMKETEPLYWKDPNTGATNESGFAGRAGGGFVKLAGMEIIDYISPEKGYFGFWWSSTGSSTANANYISLSSNSEGIFFGAMVEEASISVRCIRDY